ncbi:MAG: NAD-binding protein [Candidatus Methanoperedens sp.]|nr:NAD-binding protein [Candidatus Methanoperedens sp.]
MTHTTNNSIHVIQRIRIFWRKHLQKIWRTVQWPLIATLGLIALVLGYIGFEKHFDFYGMAHSPLDLLYASLQLFVISAPIETGPIPIELELARYLAMVVAFYTVLTALMVILNEQVQSLRLRMIKDHIVICGLGHKGSHLLTKLNESGEQVVVIECDENNDMIKTCAEQGTIVLSGDAQDEELLRKAGVHKAKYVVSFCGDDSTNIQVAILSREIAIGRKKMLTCIAGINDPHISQILGGLEMEMEKANFFRLEFFNIFEIGVRTLLKQYPPYNDLHTNPHILVVGLGDIGENLIVQIARTWRSTHKELVELGKRLCITLIDKDAESIKRSICLQNPQLEKVCEFVALELDVRSSEFYQSKLLLESQDRDITSVYVCLDEDYLGLPVALMVRKQLRDEKIPIIVQTSQDSGMVTLLEGGGFENIHVFGLLDRACGPELVLGGIREVLARAIHEEYLTHQKKTAQNSSKNPSNVPWEELPEGLKESNRLQADHIGVKLKAIDCGISPLIDWDAISFEFSTEEIELMAEMEHERWVEERQSDGWKFGSTKNLEGKISPYLVPWNQLSDEIKGYDRIFIRKLPAFLYESGFQIYRF